MPVVVTPALVVDRIAYGDKDLIVTLLTRDAGLVSAMARSARGSRRRFPSSLDLFVCVQAHLSTRPGPGLASLIAAEPDRAFPGILESLDRLRVGQAMLVLARDLLRDAPAGPTTFERLLGALAALERDPSPHATLVRLAMDLLSELGHAPSTTSCPVCGGDLRVPPTGRAVLLPDGRIVCDVCCAGRLGMPVPATLLGDGDPAPSPGEAAAFVTALMSAVLGRPYTLPLGLDP